MPRTQRSAVWLERTVGRLPWLKAALLSPVVALPGYWFVTASATVWGALLSLGRMRSRGGLLVAARMPRWGFGRGGTTLGAVYLTKDNTTAPVLRHEAVHRAQWKHYGLAFIPLYVAAGKDPIRNRFEVEAGLHDGGYV